MPHAPRVPFLAKLRLSGSLRRNLRRIGYGRVTSVPTPGAPDDSRTFHPVEEAEPAMKHFMGDAEVPRRHPTQRGTAAIGAGRIERQATPFPWNSRTRCG
jgi:hypothetical protein